MKAYKLLQISIHRLTLKFKSMVKRKTHANNFSTLKF